MISLDAHFSRVLIDINAPVQDGGMFPPATERPATRVAELKTCQWSWQGLRPSSRTSRPFWPRRNLTGRTGTTGEGGPSGRYAGSTESNKGGRATSAAAGPRTGFVRATAGRLR